jgi:signal transduction histidine kinase
MLQDTVGVATGVAGVGALAITQQVLPWALVAAGAIVGGAIATSMYWALRHGRRARALAVVGGQLVVARDAAGRSEPLSVPPRFAWLFMAPPQADVPLPPWRPELAEALDALAARAGAGDEDAAAVECTVDGVRLRLVGLRTGADGGLIVRIAEAGPDEARLNRLETAALLSGGLAHDLRNVLNTLVLHAEVGGEQTGNPARVRSHFDSVRMGAERAADLVSIMRRQLRGEDADQEPVVVRVADAVREMIALLRPAFPRGLTVLVEASAPDAAVRVPEAVQLDQIVLNLVLNAMQAMEGRPEPQLRIGIAEEAHDGVVQAVLTVDDNGPGMPPEVRARCFDPYFTTKAARSGTGLGLAVVRALIVDVLGGSVAAEEAATGGARFVVRLPSATAVAAADESHPAVLDPSAGAPRAAGLTTV